MAGKALRDYHYQDYGSLVSLGKYSTAGSLMGNLMGSVMVEGLIARLVYLSLYKMHQLALFGGLRVSLLMLANFFRRPCDPKSSCTDPVLRRTYSEMPFAAICQPAEGAHWAAATPQPKKTSRVCMVSRYSRTETSLPSRMTCMKW